jgi:hypothetical protein
MCLRTAGVVFHAHFVVARSERKELKGRIAGLLVEEAVCVGIGAVAGKAAVHVVVIAFPAEGRGVINGCDGHLRDQMGMWSMWR